MERNENVEKLMATITGLGFSKDVQEQVREQMNSGLAAFAAYESLQMGQNKVDYQLNFSPSKNAENTNVYLNTIDVLLNKAVSVPHKVVLGYDTMEMEKLLMLKPLPEMVNAANKQEYEQMLYVHNAKVEEKMKFLFENAPDVFNALYVKYRPDVDIKITPEMQKQQEQLQEGLVKYNSFSTYYNLTKLELYNALDGGSVFKSLFKTNKGEEQEVKEKAVHPSDAQKQPEPSSDEQKGNKKYNAWVKVNFEAKRPDGSYEMLMFHENRDFNLAEHLSKFNFKETNDSFSRRDVMYFMKKGSLIELTNAGDSGEKKVLARANAQYKSIDLFKLTGEPMRNPFPYLKNGLAVEVADVVTFKKASEFNASSVRPESMSKEMREEKAAVFQSAKTILVQDQKDRVVAGGPNKAAEKAHDQNNTSVRGDLNKAPEAERDQKNTSLSGSLNKPTETAPSETRLSGTGNGESVSKESKSSLAQNVTIERKNRKESRVISGEGAGQRRSR